MGIIYFPIVGLIAGALASYLMGRQQDLLVNLLIGVIGAVVGGLLAGLLGMGASNIIGAIIIATLGAILCLFVWQRMRQRARSETSGGALHGAGNPTLS
jgi:uncharacterized membrane protein YeaQ/YmgE (transglycosylase-associated protein family)